MITSDAVDDEAASRAAVLVNLAGDFPLLAVLCYLKIIKIEFYFKYWR